MAEENAAQVTDAVSTLNNMNFLQTSEAWKELITELEAVYEPLIQEVLFKTPTDGEVTTDAYNKGKLAAWKHIVTLPHMMAEQSQDVLDMIKAKAEGEDNGDSS